jgi:hypothetical protein
MPRVGMYTYPLFRLSSLLNATKTLHEKFGNKDFTRDHVAQVLGQKSTSGGLSQKLADLKSYGLISDSHGKFVVTEVGIKATFGREVEKKEALDKAVKNIPLWRSIYEKCGKEPLADTFDLDLAEITGITAPESKNVAGTVRKSYMDDIKYMLSVKTPEEEPEPEKPSSGGDLDPARGRKSGMECQTDISGSAIGYIGYPEYSQAPIEIKDAISLEIAQKLLDAIGAKIKSTQRSVQSSSEKSSEQNVENSV